MKFNENTTAIIESVKVGRVDHYRGITYSISFDMNGTGCQLTFGENDILKMMSDAKIFNDVLELIGKPCIIFINEKNTCEFKGMWKKT